MHARSRRPEAACALPAGACRDEIEISVDDDGPGIRPEALDKIFERFYTDRPDQGFGQNSGLGLSISKQIIEAHGGTIRAENRLGAATGWRTAAGLGARFVVRLPAISDGRATDPTIHASAILVGPKAALIRGPAGSGKSRLTWGLL